MPLPVEKRSRYNFFYRQGLNVVGGVFAGAMMVLLDLTNGPIGHWLANPQVTAWGGSLLSVLAGGILVAGFDRF